ncbi:hypothetical protein L6R49_23710 [Myxococcota bacterium]|nr:hypothetical protein [Myxococcota bacterium]
MSLPVLFFAFACVMGAGAEGSAPAPAAEVAADLPSMYAAAVTDASTPTAEDIVSTLTVISADNAALQWEGEAKGRVKLLTWTGWDGYDALVGQDTTLSREVWVTVTPELETACRGWGLDAGATTLRLEQLLGLPPGNGKTRFVAVYAKPEDLFRPCASGEITTPTCGLDFTPDVSPEHKAWVENLRATSYGPSGYPWTQLGYTYDWSGDGDKVGLTELVIRQGSTVGVASVSDLATVCGGA